MFSPPGAADPFDCPGHLEHLARGDTPLEDEATGDISYVDEDETADAAEVGTPKGEWRLTQDPNAPDGWRIDSLPPELRP